MKSIQPKYSRRAASLNSTWQLHLMLLIPVIMVIIFHYGPMYGLVIAFQKFRPARGLFGDQKWVGLENFRFVLSLPDTWQVVWNTLRIAVGKIVMGIVVPVFFALLLNEVRREMVRRVFQTIVYLPHFLSWVLIAGIMKEILSLSGLVNKGLNALGLESVYFLGKPELFPTMMILLEIWKSFGYGTIIYLAALTNIDPSLYEAAQVDGAKQLQQVWHITLPGILPTVILMTTLSLGNVLNAGFDQIYNLYSVQVYSTGDIIDTYVYRMGMINAQYSYATAVGMLKALVSSGLIGTSYYLAYRFAGYRIF